MSDNFVVNANFSKFGRVSRDLSVSLVTSMDSAKKSNMITK